MSVNTSGQYTIYTLPRKFRSDAKLHPFLAMKTPDMIKANKVEYTLFTVLSAMRSLISSERLYDANNTTVIICSPELEGALGMKSLHVTEVRDVVLTQMEVLQPELLASLPESQPVEQVRNNAVGGTQPQNGNVKFDVNGRFYVKPHFLRVLRKVAVVDKSQILFTYKEVTSYLSQYILDNKDRFFDDRNIKIAHVEQDILGIAFNVKAFHRTQVTTLLRNQLIPCKENNLSNGSVKPQPPRGPVVVNSAYSVTTELTNPLQQIHDLASRKRSAPVLDSPSPKGRRRSITIELPEPAEKHEDSDDDEDEEVHEYDVYEIEYEPEEASDCDEPPSKKSGGDNSSGESEIENNIILATVANILDQGSDDSIGADASSDDDDDFTKCDLENRDSWTCLDCKQPNTPYIRYCSTCYKERKGWLPARPKPKKKRSKKTSGVLIKGKASSSTNYERSLSQETVKTESSQASSSQDSGFSEDVQKLISEESSDDEVAKQSDDEIDKQNEGIKKSLANTLGANSSLALTDSLCNLCYSRPKDACLIHGRTSHQYCCYSCAKKLYKKRQGCPVCRRKIEKITKNIVA